MAGDWLGDDANCVLAREPRLSDTHPLMCASARPSVCRSVRPSVCPFVRPSVRTSVCSSVCSRVRACSTTDSLVTRGKLKSNAKRVWEHDILEPRTTTPSSSLSSSSSSSSSRSLEGRSQRPPFLSLSRLPPSSSGTTGRKFVGYGSESGRKCGIRSAILKNSAPLKIPPSHTPACLPAARR